MKDTQQRLVIEDIDYCNTVGDKTEEIVGGKSFWDRNFWKAVRGEAQDTGNAAKKAAVDLFTKGTLPTGKTAEDLLVPIEWRVLDRLF
jgi:hypothetical protein